MASPILDEICSVPALIQSRKIEQGISKCTGSIWNSGLITTTPTLSEFARGSSPTGLEEFFTMPSESIFHNAKVDPEDPDCNICVTADRLSGKVHKLVKVACIRDAFLNNWCNTTGITSSNLLLDSIADHLVIDIEYQVIALLNGIMQDSIDNHNSDLVFGDGILPWEFDTFIDASTSFGCTPSNGSMGMIIHTNVYRELIKNFPSEVVYESRAIDGVGDLTVYNGVRVYQSDNPYLTDNPSNPSAATSYRSIIFKNGAVEFGQGRHPAPIERLNDPSADCGLGAEVIYARNVYALRMLGYDQIFDQSSSDYFTPTPDDLANPVFTDRKFTQRQSIPVAFIWTGA